MLSFFKFTCEEEYFIVNRGKGASLLPDDDFFK